MNIDGKNGLACTTAIEDCKGEVKITPLPHMEVIKDLVPDFTHFYAQYASIKPWLQTVSPAPGKERLQSPEQREKGLQMAQEFVRDFHRIGVAPGFPDLFTPAVSQLLFDQSVAWLEARFAEPFDGLTVVITHFAPSPASIAPQFVGSPLNACFVSDLEAHILRWQPRLWLHGHVHHSCDYWLGATRVVANPRGYAPKGVVENAHFAPNMLIEV